MSSVINWSAHQTKIFEFVTHGKGSAVVIAVAGAGKSTTILHAARLLPVSHRVLMMAFNASAAATLKTKLATFGATNIEARTFHSLGAGSLWVHGKHNKIPLREPNANKIADMIFLLTEWNGADKRARAVAHADYEWIRKAASTRLSDDQAGFAGQAIAKLVSLAKQYVVGILEEDNDAWWTWACDNFEIESNEDEGRVTQEEIIAIARALFRGSVLYYKARGALDFDDQIYLPIKFGLNIKKYDDIFLDEAQDTNPARRYLARLAMAPGARLIAVGDPHQAIYGFTGANSDAIDLIKREFNAIELPLTVSYRCPVNVVEAAREFVSHIEPAPSAPDGSVSECDELNAKGLLPTDAVLCRVNAPLVKIAYHQMSNGKGVRILGRDIGTGLVKFIDKLNGKKGGQDLERLVEKLEVWKTREIEKATAKNNESKIDAIEDRAACIMTVIEALPENKRTVRALKETFESMFKDDGEGVTTLSSVHKAKGGEWQRVFIVGRADMPSPRARLDWQKDQEKNLLYVAYTRAQVDLVLVNSTNIEA